MKRTVSLLSARLLRRTRRFRNLLVIILATGVITAGGALAFSSISGAEDSVALTGNRPAEAESLLQRGNADPGMILTMQIRLALHHQQALDTLLAEQQNPASPNYHKWISSEDFQRRFGPTPAQVKAISKWLVTEGFTISRTTANFI